MEQFKYLIIGGGVSGTTAAETIRKGDVSGSIAIVSDEPHRFYSRIMLSKPNFFLEKIPFESVWLRKQDWYAQNNIVFMGGSLIPHGGQNFIEPAAYGKPVITGSHVQNFKSACDLFRSNDAIEVVHSGSELTDSLRNLLSDEGRRNAMGERAKKIVLENTGSTERNVELVREFLS